MHVMASDPKPLRVNLSVRIRKDIADEARRVALHEAGYPRFLKLNTLVEAALEAYLQQIKSEGTKLATSRNHLPTRSRQRD